MGMTAMGAYRLVLYAFGVFIGPIKEEIGWSYGAISGAFSMGVLVSGVLATVTGCLLDTIGSRPVMFGSLAIGSVCLYLAASTHSQILFIIFWGVGGGVIGIVIPAEARI